MRATFLQSQIANVATLAAHHGLQMQTLYFFSGSDAGPSQLCLQRQADSSKEGMISSHSRLWGCEGERMKFSSCRRSTLEGQQSLISPVIRPLPMGRRHRVSHRHQLCIPNSSSKFH